MRDKLIRAFGGQFLADLAHKLEAGDFGETAEAAYRALKGRKRLIGALLYAAGYAAAATATALGGCVVDVAAAMAAACAWTVNASRVVTWLGWALLQLGILDANARRKPDRIAEAFGGVAGAQFLVLALVFGLGYAAQAFGLPAEVVDTFTRDVLLATLAHVGLVGAGTAARVSSPSLRGVRS